ncbi:hypothetical protein BKA80DRAFT_299635 [Phyllosticta citrichinensis]
MHPIVTMTCRPGPVASRVSTMFFSFSLLLFSAANPPASADAKADVAVVAQCTYFFESDCRRGEPPFEEMGGQTERYTPSTVRTERVKAVKEPWTALEMKLFELLGRSSVVDTVAHLTLPNQARYKQSAAVQGKSPGDQTG